MDIKAVDVKVLRDEVGAGFMDCKNALIEAKGDKEEAIRILKKKGMAKAQKKSGREATDGAVGFVISENRQEAAIVEVNCETDFVARSDAFNDFLAAFARGVIAKKVTNDDISQVEVDGKPIEDARHAAVLKLGENIQVKRGQYLDGSTESGSIYGYSHGSKISVLVLLEKPDDQLGKDIAMHIAALNPAAVTEQDIPEKILSDERAIYQEQLEGSKKPQEIMDKIIAGKLKKFASGLCLYGQPFVKDPKETIEEILKKNKNHVKTFIRFALGE